MSGTAAGMISRTMLSRAFQSVFGSSVRAGVTVREEGGGGERERKERRY